MDHKKAKNNNREQSKDTGMAMVLILLMAAWFTGDKRYLAAAIIVLVISMASPMVFFPLGKVWFGFSHYLGLIVSKIVLSVIFVLIVVPVGLARRMAGKDPMGFREWKKGKSSVFKVREHIFRPEDLKKPF